MQDYIQVSLDKDLVQQLLNGLYRGASAKALKVVISVDGSYHIVSKELRMIVEIDEAKMTMNRIHIHNGKQYAVVTADDLNSMGLTNLSRDVVKELKEKYSPVFHSLADNIIVFGRSYG